MIQAEVVHHSLAKILSQATVDLQSTVDSELRLAGRTASLVAEGATVGPTDTT